MRRAPIIILSFLFRGAYPEAHNATKQADDLGFIQKKPKLARLRMTSEKAKIGNQ